MRSIILLVLLASFSAPVQAGFISGAKLHSEMSEWQRFNGGTGARDAKLSAGFFEGYISGVFDAYESAGRVCSPDIPGNTKIVNDVANYLQTSSPNRGLPAINQVESAVFALFSCTGSVKPSGKSLRSLSSLRAQYSEFNGLKNERDTSRDALQAGNFLGYISGAFETYEKNGQVCGSSSLAIGDVLRVVGTYVQVSTGLGSHSAINLVYSALLDQYRCL